MEEYNSSYFEGLTDLSEPDLIARLKRMVDQAEKDAASTVKGDFDSKVRLRYLMCRIGDMALVVRGRANMRHKQEANHPLASIIKDLKEREANDAVRREGIQARAELAREKAKVKIERLKEAEKAQKAKRAEELEAKRKAAKEKEEKKSKTEKLEQVIKEIRERARGGQHKEAEDQL